MYVNFGSYHPFTLHKEECNIRLNVVYDLEQYVDWIFSENDGEIASIKAVRLDTGAEVNVPTIQYVWTVNGVELKASRAKIFPLSLALESFYIKITMVSGDIYYSDAVKINLASNNILETTNSCSNNWFDWRETLRH